MTALAVTASAFAAVQRGNDARVKMMPRSLVANPIAENIAIAPATATVKAPAVAGITTAAAADDAVGLYKAVLTDADGTYYHYTSLDATGGNSVVINGIYYYDAKVPAMVDVASGDLVIPSCSVVYDGATILSISPLSVMMPRCYLMISCLQMPATAATPARSMWDIYLSIRALLSYRRLFCWTIWSAPMRLIRVSSPMCMNMTTRMAIRPTIMSKHCIAMPDLTITR